MQTRNMVINELKKLLQSGKQKERLVVTQFDNTVVRQPNAATDSKTIRSNHSTMLATPQRLKSYQVKDKVVPNISQVKFTKKEVEDNHRISSISKKTKVLYTMRLSTHPIIVDSGCTKHMTAISSF
ncbi:hypothetical protein Tco_0034281 [Tanacetum coccineum]